MIPIISVPQRVQRAVDGAGLQRRSLVSNQLLLLYAGIFGFSFLYISEEPIQQGFVHLPNHKAPCNTDQENTILVLLFEPHLSCIFHMLPVRHKYITVHFIHTGSVPGKVSIHTWGGEKKIKEQFPSITMAHFIALQLTMVFCAACGIAAVSCYGEQSNSSDIVTHQPENNNQQIHHSSDTASSHFGLKQSTKTELHHKKASLVNEPTYYRELQTFGYRTL